LEAILAACADAGLDPHDVDGFVSYANDLNEGLAVGAALGVREVRWSTMVWGGGGGGVAAAVNAAAAAVACGQAEHVIVYRGITEADDGRQSYGKGHFPPLLSAHGVLTPVQCCALRAEAGVKASEVDVVQVYENFSGPAVASLIDLGLCPPGPEAGSFMTVPNLIAPDGALPINTAGGNIAEDFVHGIGLVQEAVRQ